MNHDCTLYKTMDYLAKRWTILILLELRKGEQEWKRFSAIRESMKDITPKVLSERLKDLEAEGLVSKRVDASAFPIKSEYRLTEAGEELVEAVKQIKYWALKWKIRNEICLRQDCRSCGL
ncbi:MAG: helix-turn-helix transcriptional regulator [Methanomassiliicoccaceae archaeon]|nr:helix-turn-helix transcriptional regulator [Methanomassiliicoccaceae archaeon]MCL2145728.1 helix-turn-helix transcriptional regulator [Methanomassiliicoccaceae archaeon]